MVMGTFPGIYAINPIQDNTQSVNINKINNTINNGTRTIYVSKNGTDRNDGLTSGKAKLNIQNAIIVANHGDTIKVGPGTYQDNLQIDKNITLMGNIQNNTIIDGKHVTSCIHIHPGIRATIINFTLKNGNSNSCGGGISNDGILTLKNSSITDNEAVVGGGIDNPGKMTISGVTIKNNVANFVGGGVCSDGTLTIENSTITNNTALAIGGGGIYNGGIMTISEVTIKNNFARDSGGGVSSSGTLTIEDSAITDNGATFGGGIINYSRLTVYGSTITRNGAIYGGGISNNGKSYVDDITLITNNSPDNFLGKPFIPA
jgi:predicted outer membrane repeat protein